MDRIGSFPIFVRASTDDTSTPSSTAKLDSLLELVVAAGGKLGLVPQRSMEKRTHFAVRSHGQDGHGDSGTEEDERELMLITRTAWSPSSWSMEHCLDPSFIQTWMWMHGVRGSCGMRFNFESMFSAGDDGRGYHLGFFDAGYALSSSENYLYFPFKDVTIATNARCLVPPVMLTLRDIRLPSVIEKMVSRKLTERRRRRPNGSYGTMPDSISLSSFRGTSAITMGTHHGRGDMSRGRGGRGRSSRGFRGRGRYGWTTEGTQEQWNNRNSFVAEEDDISYDEERLHHLRLEMLQRLVLGDGDSVGKEEEEEDSQIRAKDKKDLPESSNDVHHDSQSGKADLAASTVVSSLSSSAAMSSGRTPLKGLQHFALSSILLGNHTILQGPQNSGKRVGTYLGISCNLLSLAVKEREDDPEAPSQGGEENDGISSTGKDSPDDDGGKRSHSTSNPEPRALLLFPSYSDIIQYVHWVTDVFGSEAFHFFHMNRDNGLVEPLVLEGRSDRQTTNSRQEAPGPLVYAPSMVHSMMPEGPLASPFLSVLPPAPGGESTVFPSAPTDPFSPLPDIDQLMQLVVPPDSAAEVENREQTSCSRDSASGVREKRDEKSEESRRKDESLYEGESRHLRRQGRESREHRHRSRSQDGERNNHDPSRRHHRHRRHSSEENEPSSRRRRSEKRRYSDEDEEKYHHRRDRDRHDRRYSRRRSHRHRHRSPSSSGSDERRGRGDEKRGSGNLEKREGRRRRSDRHERRDEIADEDGYYEYKHSHKSSHHRHHSRRSRSRSDEYKERKRRRTSLEENERKTELSASANEDTSCAADLPIHTSESIIKSVPPGMVSGDTLLTPMDSTLPPKPDVDTLLSTVLGNADPVPLETQGNSAVGVSDASAVTSVTVEPLIPVYLTMRVPVLLLTYHGLRDALAGDQYASGGNDDANAGISPASVALPIERVRFLTLFDADRLLRPPLSDGLSPSQWVSVMNTVDVDCQLVLTSRNASALEDIQTLVTNTLLPDVAEEQLWTWSMSDDTIWSFVDTQVTPVEVRGTGTVENNEEENKDRSPQYRGGHERGDGARRPRITGEDIDAAKLSHAAAVIINHFREYTSSSESHNTSSGWQCPRVVVCCTTRREQGMIPDALSRIFREMSTSSDPCALLRVTTVPSTFGKGLAEVLVVCDTQIQDSAEQRILREQCAVHFHCVLHFSIPKPILQRCGEDGWLLRSWLGSRARCLLGDTRHIYRQTANAVKPSPISDAHVENKPATSNVERIPMFVLLTDFQLRGRMADRIQEALAPGSTSITA